jgi:sec-independent protein translocase protein TatB
MFDIGVSEIFVIGVVALVVIGPEKLPKVARTVGHLSGRLQRYVTEVKADISREIELEELRKFKEDFETSARSFESSVRTEIGKAESGLQQAADQMASVDTAIQQTVTQVTQDLQSIAADAPAGAAGAGSAPDGVPPGAPDAATLPPGGEVANPLAPAPDPGHGPLADAPLAAGEAAAPTPFFVQGALAYEAHGFHGAEGPVAER